jgi:hypothetical protein
VDRAVVEDLRIDLTEMTENAGRTPEAAEG